MEGERKCEGDAKFRIADSLDLCGDHYRCFREGMQEFGQLFSVKSIPRNELRFCKVIIKNLEEREDAR